MAGKRFVDGVDDLLRRTGGGGSIKARVVVDQPYAEFQHESLDLRHRGGGGAKFLSRPNADRTPATLQRVADRLFEQDGIRNSMISHADKVSAGVFEQAPFEFGDLRASGHPSVLDGHSLVYDKAPNVHRLSAAEIRAKDHIRELGLGGA